MQIKGQAPAASARPDIISLDVLLKDVDEGRVQIPRFQRPYVWTPQMMRDLFESVLSGFPIGSLLFWEPRFAKVRTMEHIGPLPAPSRPESGTVSFVLDGHQRLATLYGVLRLEEGRPVAGASSDDLAWWIAYDLEAQEVRQLRDRDDFENPRLLPLRAVLRTVEFVRFARLIDSSVLLTDEQKLAYLDRADGVQRAVRDYRLALTIMRDGTVDDAVAIFSRINRSGRKITTDQMAGALTYDDEFSLEDKIDEILGSLDSFGFGDVSRVVVLQSLLHGAGLNFVKPNFDDLREAQTRDAIKAAVAPVAESLRRAAGFLNRVIGFRTGRLLPYALQLFLLGVFFRSRGDFAPQGSRAADLALSKWFWATSFSGWFASANSSEIESAVRAMEKFAQSADRQESIRELDGFFNDRPLRPFPKTFDRRSARIRSLLLVQIVRGPLFDPISGERIDGSSLIADPDRRDLPYVFRSVRAKASRSPANRILLPRTHGSAVRDALAEHLDRVDALQSHAINGVARKAIVERDLDAFVIAREAELARHEKEFLERFDLRIGDGIERSEDAVDIDDD